MIVPFNLNVKIFPSGRRSHKQGPGREDTNISPLKCILRSSFSRAIHDHLSIRCIEQIRGRRSSIERCDGVRGANSPIKCIPFLLKDLLHCCSLTSSTISGLVITDYDHTTNTTRINVEQSLITSIPPSCPEYIGIEQIASINQSSTTRTRSRSSLAGWARDKRWFE